MRLISSVVGLLLVVGYFFTSGFNQKTSGDSIIQETQSSPNQAIPYSTFLLDNGLRVVVHSNHNVPKVHVQAWYNVGARHEEASKTGLAHLFEHIMTNGSENFPDFFINAYKGLGASGFNATTNMDRTNYFISVPTRALDRAIWVESERMGHMLGTLTQEKLDREIANVLSEDLGKGVAAEDDMTQILNQNLFGMDHPYNHRISGDMDDIRASTLADSHNFFKSYYAPSNAVLVLAGDIAYDQAKELVTKYFSHIPKGNDVDQIKPEVQKLNQTITGEYYSNRGTTLVRAWPVPGYGKQATSDLTLWTSLVRGKLMAVARKSPLIRRVMVTNAPMELAGIFSVTLSIKNAAAADEATQILDAAMADILATPVAGTALDKLKLKEKIGWAYKLDAGNSTHLLAENALFGNGQDTLSLTKLWTQQATPASLQATAQAWLDTPYFQGVFTPNAAKAANVIIKSKADKAQETFSLPAVTKRELNVMPTVGPQSELAMPVSKKITLSNGNTVHYIHRDNMQITHMGMVIRAGQQSDPLGKANLSQVATAMLSGTSRKMSAADRKKALALIGANLKVTSDSYATQVRAAALNQEFDALVTTLADILTNREIDPKAMQKALKKSYQPRQRRVVKSVKRTRDLLHKSVYGTPIPDQAQAPHSTEGQTSITATDINAWQDEWIRPERATFFIISGLDEETITQTLENQLVEWKTAAPMQFDKISPVPVAKATNTAPTPIKSDKIRTVLHGYPNAKQAGVSAAIGIPNLGTEDADAMSVLSKVYGGFGTGRIHDVMRNQKGWAYMATGMYGNDMFHMTAFVAPENAQKAVMEYKHQLELLAGSKPITQEEFDTVVSDRMGRAQALYSNANIFLNDMTKYYAQGTALDHKIQAARKFKTLKLEDVHDLTKRVIKPENITFVIQGNIDGIKADIINNPMLEIVK